MGTNYYWIKPASPPCRTCGRYDVAEERHIGKSSAGWCFTMHIYPEEGIKNFDDWKTLFQKEGTIIKDEYGRIVSLKDMYATIRNRHWGGRTDDLTEHYLSMNSAVRGPKGLLRHKIEEGHCIGHGKGTWDYIIGDFS